MNFRKEVLASNPDIIHEPVDQDPNLNSWTHISICTLHTPREPGPYEYIPGTDQAMKRALLRSLGRTRYTNTRPRHLPVYCSFSTKVVGSTDEVWRQQTRELLSTNTPGETSYQTHDIQALLSWWCRTRTAESASVVWKLYDLNRPPTMRSTVLDHWRWCIKLSLPIEEDCHEVWYKWLEDCLLYTSPSPRDLSTSRMPSSA